MKLTFECKENTYKWLCNVEEYVRRSSEWQHRKFETLDDVIELVLSQGFEKLYMEDLQFQVYDATLHGAEVERDVDGEITGFFFPEKPKDPDVPPEAS